MLTHFLCEPAGGNRFLAVASAGGRDAEGGVGGEKAVGGAAAERGLGGTPRLSLTDSVSERAAAGHPLIQLLQVPVQPQSTVQ